MEDVTVIGAGLAGCEAAYKIAQSGYKVKLIECKPKQFSPAHKSENFAELVCSNSLKSDERATAGGLLKAEMRSLGSLLIKLAESARVPAGGALAVDREIFSHSVTKAISEHKNIRIVNETASDWQDGELTVIATGPLTVGGLASSLERRLGSSLSFYDAAAPIVDAQSIDMNECFAASRYGKGESDYLNCPLEKQEYIEFYESLISAERAELHEFDKRDVFDGCMPIEIMAERGVDTMRFGPLRPVGFINPRTERRPYAVVQLRTENAQKTMYNIVGFQTNLKFAEQKRVFGMIPALRNAEFLRYGVMHRNTYINAPRELDRYSRLNRFPNVFIAGQLSGVEGYVESIASGLMAGINVSRVLGGKEPLALPPTTIMGALFGYLCAPNADFQPMNANFGVLPPLQTHIRDKAKRKEEYWDRSLRDLAEFQKENNLI